MKRKFFPRFFTEISLLDKMVHNDRLLTVFENFIQIGMRRFLNEAEQKGRAGK